MNPHTRSITVILREEMKWTMIVSTNKIKRALGYARLNRALAASRYLSLPLSRIMVQIIARTFLEIDKRARFLTIKSGQSPPQI